MHFNDEYFDTLNVEIQAYLIFSHLSRTKISKELSMHLYQLKVHENNYVNARNMMLQAIEIIKKEYNK